MRLAFIVSIVFLVAACGGKATPAASQKSLYERLGGTEGITAVVEEFVATTGSDPRISVFFTNADLPRLKKLMVEQICAATGGPCTYTGKTMKESHANMHVKQPDFDAFIDDLTRTLDKTHVKDPEKTEVLTAFRGMQGDVVTE